MAIGGAGTGVGWPARRVGRTACVTLGYFLLTLGTIWLSIKHNGLAAIWPANALLLATMLSTARVRSEIVALSGGALVAAFAANLLFGAGPAPAAGYALSHVVEALLALAICRVRIAGGFDLDRVDHVLTFAAAAILAPVVGAVLAVLSASSAVRLTSGQFWIGWYGASALGLLIVTPTLIVGRRLMDEHRRGIAAARPLAEVIAVLGAVAIVAALVFGATSRPLLFAITPLVLVATFRLRTVGAAAATVIVGVVGAWATTRGLGPIAHGPGLSGDRLMFLQFYLGVTFVSALPLAAAIAERDRRTREADEAAERLRSVVENIGEVIFRTDIDGRWTYLNPAWEAISGYRIEPSLGQCCLAHVEEADRLVMRDRMAPLFAGHTPEVRRVIRFQTAAGPVRWMEVLIQGLTDAKGTVTGTTGTLRDIDARKRLEEDVASAKRRAEEMARQATLLAATDELTGVPNRRGFMRQLDREIEAAIELGRPLTVALFDLDYFKRVNDRFGHATGDRILHAVAQRAVKVVRSGDLVGRLGGEEFGILMPGASADDAAMVAERLRDAIESGDADEATLPPVTISIGIARLDGLMTGAALLHAADGALYAAKDGGRNQVQIAA